ncbi:MAG: hypothetical protein Kow00127_01700 [Bacteroidales bacterium]
MTLLLVLVYATLIFAQNIVYIDPTNSGDPAEDGTVEHPFDSWGDFTLAENTTYLQKAGTVYQLSGTLNIDNINNVTIGAYGEGPRPVLQSNPASNAAIIRVARATNTVIDGLAIIGDLSNSPVAGVFVSGHWSSGGAPTINTTINNCEIAYVYNGVRGIPASTLIETITITNTEIHHINEDGVFIKHVPNITIEGCHMWHINLDWHLQGHLESQSPGDCIHILGDCNNYLIKDNILDRRYTGNKFCFIYGNTHYTPEVRGRVIGNTLYPPKDTVNGNGGAALYLSESGHVEIAYNKIIGRGYQWGGTPVTAAHIEVDSVDCYYNLIDSVSGLNFVMKNDFVNFYNNMLICNNDVDWGVLFSGTEAGTLRNNIIAVRSGTPAYFINTGLVNEYNLLIEGGEDTWNQDIGIVSWENGDFHLTENSACVNAGYNYNDYNYDLEETPVPQMGIRDMGPYEYVDGTSTNNPPVINNQTFSVDENSSSGTVVGTVVATDPDPDQTLTFAITSGNQNSTFTINAVSGEITVNDPSLLDFESNPSFTLTVLVTDNGNAPLSNSASVVIQVNDLNEIPEVNDQNLDIEENMPQGSSVGLIEATDPDNGQQLSFAIISGNVNSAFAIDNSGNLTVSNAAALDYESQPVFNLVVEVTDNGSSPLSAQANVVVNLLDVNEAPEITDQQFTIEENSSTGTLAGQVTATDPDNGQQLSFAIISGNVNSAFAIDNSGNLTVSNAAALDYESQPVFNLVVEVTDNGSSPLSAQADVVVNLLDVNEAPEITDQQFTIEENSSTGTLAGEVTATDPDNGQQLSFAIISGNVNSAFAIDNSGNLTVSNAAALDYESQPVFNLVVEVTDNGSSPLSAQADVTVNLLDVNEVPVVEDQFFTLEENSPAGFEVGLVAASDPDQGQSLSWEITAGNSSGAFAVDPDNGIITVADASEIDFESNPQFVLEVQVTDNGINPLSATAVVYILVLDVNEPPQILTSNLSVDVEQQYVENEFSNIKLDVGIVDANDPDIGQSLTWEIVSGNDRNIWSIEAETGELSLINPYELSPFEINNYPVTVSVTDNGTNTLSATATVLIHVNITATPGNDDDPGGDLSGDLAGTNETESTPFFTLYPNPAHNFAQIDLTGSEINAAGPLTILVTNMNGSVVYQYQAETVNGNFSHQIDVGRLSTGIYLVRLLHGKVSGYRKLVVR